MTFQVEMRWRCGVPSCQTEMLGRYKKCSNCGKPKEREPYYDAEETVTRADAVTDLLKQATAGKDFECKYCGSHERRDSGECRNCGSSSTDSLTPTARTNPPAARKPEPEPEPEKMSLQERARLCTPWLIGGSVAVLVVFGLWLLLRSHEVTARVAERQWTHTVQVERYQVVEDDGFREATPHDAFDVVSAGMRVHHYDRVPDGYRSEPYQDSYTCGETCTTTPIRCSSNDNGFKTCSGGDRRCSPKTCYRTKYRDVKQYRDDPVYRSWYRWKAWRWRHNRNVVEAGRGGKVRWPSPEKVALGDRERPIRSAEYAVVFVDGEGEHHKYRPEGLPEYLRLSEGRSERLSVALTGVSIVQEAQ